MAFIETIPPATARGETRAMYARQQAHCGYVPNYARVFGHRPAVMRAWAEMIREIRRPLDARRYALINLAAAHALGSSYCSLANARALTSHYSAAQIERILAGGADGPLDAADSAMLRFARLVARDAAAVRAQDVDALRVAGFADEEIFDIAAVAAARAFFTKLVDGLGATPDAALTLPDERLRRVLAVGRPIDTSAPERLED